MLKWNGRGFIPSVPARDLTDNEVEEYGGAEALIATGLYEPIKMERPAYQDKMERPARQDKEE